MSPPADIEVTEELLRRLLAEQFPDLADQPLRLVANGWDNAIFRVGDDLVARLPRREVAAHLIRHEQDWLGSIAERVSIAIPVPVRKGVPSETYPWHWSVLTWLSGKLAAETTGEEHRTLAGDLARFIRELHVPAPPDAPVNPVRGVPLGTRSAAIIGRIETGLIPRPDEVMSAWQAAAATPAWEGPPLWLHGDLHPANILVHDGRLRAVIDFGDMTAGDPATDLATAWLTFAPQGRADFMAELDYDDDTWARARGWAITMSTAMLAGSAPASLIHRIGADALEQVLLDA